MNDWVRTGGYIAIACKGPKRYFDLDAVRTEHAPQQGGNTTPRKAPPPEAYLGAVRAEMRAKHGKPGFTKLVQNPAGAPPLDWFIDDDDEPQTPNPPTLKGTT